MLTQLKPRLSLLLTVVGLLAFAIFGVSITAQAAGDPEGNAWAWGNGEYGQMGNNTSGNPAEDNVLPLPVNTAPTNGSQLPAGKVTAITSGFNHNCAIADGDVYCWGDGEYGQIGNGIDGEIIKVPVKATLPADATAVAGGSDFTCAIAAGNVYCWGNNWAGQLGTGDTVSSEAPGAAVAGILPAGQVTKIATGEAHVCVIAAGTVYCWGDGTSGALGNGLDTGSYLPVAVTLPGTATAISAGIGHTCAIVSSELYCWGLNGNGQLGNGSLGVGGSVLVPTDVDVVGENDSALPAGQTTAVSAGFEHTCAIAAGNVYCWGYSQGGILGHDAPHGKQIPTAVETDATEDSDSVLPAGAATVVGAGGTHSCAIAEDKAYCWGINYDGQVGNGVTANSTWEAVAVLDLDDYSVVAITLGDNHTLALVTTEDGGSGGDDDDSDDDSDDNSGSGSGNTDGLPGTGSSIAGVVLFSAVLGIGVGVAVLRKRLV